MKLQRLLAAIDHENRQDPHQETGEGQPQPKEWLYGQRMSACLAEYAPDASECLQIAARGQHIRRWDIPRSDYPQGRAPYKQWRQALARHHADVLTRLMREQGYADSDCERVANLVQKKGLKRDPEVQTLEDVICLVFLRFYAADFAAKHPADKVLDILVKTLRKMSPTGHHAAQQLPLPSAIMDALVAAMAQLNA